MTSNERLAKLVDDLFEIKDTPVHADRSALLVRHSGRIYHLGCHAERQEIVISTPVYFSFMDGAELPPDIVADFNAYHLLHGGYRLGADPVTHHLYVSQSKSLNGLEHTGLAQFLEDFAARCASCTQWCMEEIAKSSSLDVPGFVLESMTASESMLTLQEQSTF
jgi:hypothetical protein